MTRVSVVIINHNYERFVGEAVDSVLAQDHDDLQVIVVDDASTDRSLEVIEHHADRVTVLAHERNAGQGAVVNTGAAAADGDLVWFLDADDVLLPGAIAAAVAARAAQPTMAKLHSPLELLDADLTPLGRRVPTNPSLLAVGDVRAHVLRYRNHVWSAMSGNVYARWALELLLPLPAQDYRQAADAYLNELVALCGPLARSEQPLVGYRVHGANQFHGRPLSLDWLHTKLERTAVSHAKAVELADQLGLADRPGDVGQPDDVAFHGYRLASLRLEPERHPHLAPQPDRRWSLARSGLAATWRSPHLLVRERAKRTVWFATIAAAPQRSVTKLLSWYLPDGQHEPVWSRWRERLRALRTAPTHPPSPTPGAPHAIRG